MKTTRYTSSKLLKAIYTFRGFTYTSIEGMADQINITLKRTWKMGICRNCGKRTKILKESHQRTVRDLDLGPMTCYLTFNEHKLHCSCGYRGFETIYFSRSYARCTIRYEEYIIRLTEKMTISDVRMVTGLDWKTVKDIDKYYIKKRLVGLQDITPTRLGVDEVAYEKGHKYLTVVRDLDLNKVIWIGIGRRKETLDDFFTLLGKKKQRLITVVILDMWDPYIASIKEHCSSADIVFDKFHFIKKVNEAVDSIRKQEFAKAKKEERIQMKRKRFIILKRGKNLTEDQQEKLRDIMKNNEELYKAYLLKEQISDIFDEDSYPAAMQRIERWKENVNASELPKFKTVLKTFKRYGYGIKNYFIHQLTNAGSEGFNTKINIIRRKAYGFWDLDYFMLKIFQTCGVMNID
jgi:transposase